MYTHDSNDTTQHNNIILITKIQCKDNNNNNDIKHNHDNDNNNNNNDIKKTRVTSRRNYTNKIILCLTSQSIYYKIGFL